MYTTLECMPLGPFTLHYMLVGIATTQELLVARQARLADICAKGKKADAMKSFSALISYFCV